MTEVGDESTGSGRWGGPIFWILFVARRRCDERIGTYPTSDDCLGKHRPKVLRTTSLPRRFATMENRLP
ncbi:MAG: hypothetical protein KDA83_19335, partial [Planctomycetales bacterium]|nr:hypothetical protein [Planctomycetales bacterium]